MGMAMEKREDSGTQGHGAEGAARVKGGAAALSCSSCLKTEREIQEREKEIKKRMKDRKGRQQVFSTCLLAEQSYFWEAQRHLKQKQPMNMQPPVPGALGGCV